MNFNKNLLILLTIGTVSPSVLAGGFSLSNINVVGSEQSGNNSGSISSSTPSNGNVSADTVGASKIPVAKCREKVQENGIISMDELKYLNGGELPIIDAHSNKEFKLELKKFASKCATLKVNRILDGDNNHIIQFINLKEFSETDLFLTDDEKKGDVSALISKMTMDEKVSRCLVKNEYVVKKGSGYEMDRNSEKFDYSKSFLKMQDDMDSKRSSKILFASPVFENNNYKTYDDKTIDDTEGSWACTKVQDYGIDKDSSESSKFVFKSEYDKQWDLARAACQSAKEGDIYAIERLITKDTGNSSELQLKIQDVYARLLSKDIKEKSEKIVNQIEDKLSQIEKYNDPSNKTHKRKAKAIAREIQALSRQYNSEIAKPAKEVLARSLASYEELEESDSEASVKKRDILENRIERVTEALSGLSEIDMTDGVETMKIHNLHSTGKDLLSAYANSSELSKVCLDCDGQQDMEDAENKIAKRIKKYTKEDKRDWSFVSQAARGKETPMYLTQQLYTNAQKNMQTQYSQFQQNEYKKYQEYCASSMFGGMKNPIRCQYWQNSQSMRTKMFESKMKGLQADVQGYDQKYSYYQSYYDAAQRRQAEQNDREVASLQSAASPYDSFSILGGNSMMSGGGQSSMYSMGTPQFAMPLMQPR